MPRIRFADVTFPPEGELSEYKVDQRLRKFLSNYRSKNSPKSRCALSDDDREKIERRARTYVRAISQRSGMSHLDKKDRERMEVFRHGVELKSVETEHRADEIASALHTEMPWMAPATERVWQDMRASVRAGDPAPRLSSLLLVGPPGIGKSFWARLLGKMLGVPTTVIEATGEPASFSVTGSQRGWGSAGPGKPLEGIISSGLANPIIVIDEIEKAGSVHSRSGQPFNLSEGLLPLLEKSTAASWSCPYFRVRFDMSWIGWVMTANSLRGLPEPLLSRCPPLELSHLTMEQLMGFAARETERRGLPSDAADAVLEVIATIKKPHLISLRSVLRLLDAVEHAQHRPMLH